MAAVIMEFFDAVKRQDLDAVEACYHEDYKSIQPCFPSRNFEGPKAVRTVYERLYPAVPGVRYDVQRTAFTDHGAGVVTGFVECHLTDDEGRNDVKGVFIMEADGGKIRSGTLYMTPVAADAGDIGAYVDGLAGVKR